MCPCVNTRRQAWEWAQTNSVDKFDSEGSYLLSARYTNTIYKILRDGDIAWRLGGEKSDFQADFTFARQNHARVQSYNDTHTIISFLDSGDSGSGQAQSSRGMLIALHTAVEPKTASLLATYAHPDGPGSFIADEGSTQVLPDGNVFSGWAEGLLISEHDTEGRLLMSARAKRESLRSYRSYKFSFVGQPAQPPDVYAEVDQENGGLTSVYVSWNGATEVEGWNLYRTTHDGKIAGGKPVTSALRTGFETKIEIDKSVAFVVVEGVEKSGNPVGRSKVFPVVGATPTPDDLKDSTEEQSSWKQRATSRNGIASVFCVLFVIAALVFVIRRRRRRPSWRSKHSRKPSDHEMMYRHEEVYSVEDDDDDDD